VCVSVRGVCPSCVACVVHVCLSVSDTHAPHRHTHSANGLITDSDINEAWDSDDEDAPRQAAVPGLGSASMAEEEE